MFNLIELNEFNSCIQHELESRLSVTVRTVVGNRFSSNPIETMYRMQKHNAIRPPSWWSNGANTERTNSELLIMDSGSEFRMKLDKLKVLSLIGNGHSSTKY